MNYSTRKNKRSFFARIASSKPYLFVMGWLVRFVVDALFFTLRIEYRGIKKLSSPSIVALWHNKLLLAPLLVRVFKPCVFSVVASKSRDGLLLGAFAKTYPNVAVIHVGHQTRHQAAREILDKLSASSVVIITPDGPRGPLYEIKEGIVYSAQKAKATIVPMHWEATKKWQLATWDRFQIPKPFSKVVVTFNEPIPYSDIHIKELIKKSL